MSITVPFYDLNREHKKIKKKVLSAIGQVYDKGQFILGAEVKCFEEEFSKHLGVKYGVGTGNGLDALRVSLEALGIGAGDEVIVPAFTFIATWLSVSLVGAKMVGVEPDEKTFNVDVDKIEKSITDKTKAIIVVHLYGQPANMNKINQIAKKHRLFVVEDVAQAQGAHIEKQYCGSFGDVAAFSFYPAKNLGALGDAGIVLTNKKSISDFIHKKHNYGSDKKYHHEILGYNSRLDEIQAAILRVKLKTLDDLNRRRNAIVQFYLEHIENSSVVLPYCPPNYQSVWHQFVLRVRDRDSFIDHMTQYGVQTQIHYPIPPHLSEAYRKNFPASAFPLARAISREVVSIPIYPFLRREETEHIVNVINNYV